MVDLSDYELNTTHGWYNPTWLDVLAGTIAVEQTTLEGAHRWAQVELELQAEAMKKTLTLTGDELAAELARIDAALAKALANAAAAVTVPDVDTAVEIGTEAIWNGTEIPDPVDPELKPAQDAAIEALEKAAQEARDGLDETAEDYDAKVEAIDKALEDAKKAVNEATTAEDATKAGEDGVKAIEDAAKGEETPDPGDKTVAVTLDLLDEIVTMEGEELEVAGLTKEKDEDGNITITEEDFQKACTPACTFTVIEVLVDGQEVAGVDGVWTIPVTGNAVTISFGIDNLVFEAGEGDGSVDSDDGNVSVKPGEGSDVDIEPVQSPARAAGDKYRVTVTMEPGYEFVNLWLMNAKYVEEESRETDETGKTVIKIIIECTSDRKATATVQTKKAEPAGPAVTAKLVDASGVPVTEGAALEQVSCKENISGGVTTYTYEFKLTFTDALTYKYGTSEVKDSKDAPVAGIVPTYDPETGIIKVTGVTEDSILTVKLAAADVIKITVADSTVLDITPAVVPAGTKWAETPITVSLKEGMAEKGYAVPTTGIALTDGSSSLAWNTNYTYTTNEEGNLVITLKDNATTKALTAIVLTTPADLTDGSAVEVKAEGAAITGKYYTVGPKTLKQGTAFSDGPVITITPADYVQPATFTVKMADRTGTAKNLVKDTDYTFDPVTGALTLCGDKVITGDITIEIATAPTNVAPLKIDAKTGAVTKGDAPGYCYPTDYNSGLKYMVVDPEKDATLYATVEADVAGWMNAAPFLLTSVDPNFTWADTLPTLKDGSYLVAVWVKDSYVSNAGIVKLEGVTGGATPDPDAAVEMKTEDSGLTPVLSGNVITLTPAEGKLLPSTVSSIEMVGTTSLTENTDWVYDRAAGTITLNVKITGKITITAVATEYVETGYKLAFTTQTGVLTAKKSDGTTDITVADGDVAILLKSIDGVEEILKTLTTDMNLEAVGTALGIVTSGDPEYIITAASGSGLVIDAVKDDGSNAYVVFLKMSEGKVVGVGFAANTSNKTGA